MATKNFRVTGTNVPIDNNLGRLDESDQTAANRADGWTQGTKAAAQMSPFDAGTKQASTTFTATVQPASFVDGSNATANAFKTMYPLNGTFDVGNWVFTFAVRAASSATGQCGRIRLRVFKSTSYNGSVSPTELTAATQIGTTTTALSTSADRTSVVTWAPGTTIVLNNEFLFFVVAWEVTTAATNANADVLIRSGQSAGGSFLTTPNYTPVANPISNLKDSFVSSFNTLVWTDSYLASWDSGNGGQLALQCTTGYGYIDTGAQAKSYDLTGGSLIAKVTPPPTGSGSREMFMEISRIGTWGSIRDGVSLYVSGGNLGASRRLAGSVSGSATGIAFDPVNHKWWRIRESGGTIYCDTSPDGITWNNYWSTASGFDVSAIHIDFSCGYYGTETASNGYVDEINVPPSASTPISSSDSGVGGDWGVPTYKTEYFYDTFDTSVDLAKWNGSSSDPVWDGGGQRCRMPCVSSYATLATANDRPLLNLTGSFFMAKVTPPPVGTSSREMTMELRNVDDNTNKYMFYWQQGNLYIRRYLAGAVSGEKIISYSASTQWWRVRESGGTIYFDTSPDGGTWTNQLTTAPGFDITRCRYVFLCGYYATESAADGYIDNINVVPPISVSGTDTNGTVTESASVVFKATVTDTGTSSETSAPASALAGTDTGTDSESAAVQVSASDANGTTTEAASFLYAPTDSDSGSGTDTASYQQGGVQFDTGTGSDNGSLNVNVLAADPYVRTYADLPNAFATYADIPANVDIYAHLPFVPVYPLTTEDATVTALILAADTNGAVAEVATIASTAADVGTSVESTAIVAKITAIADSTTLVDETAAPVFKVTVTDAGTGVDAVVTRTAALTGTDNNGAVTETQSLVAKISDEGAQGATYDSATLVAKYTQTDGSGPTDETAVAQFVKVNVTDTNGATTETISLRLYAFDASTGTDNAILVAKFIDTDAGSSFEFALSPGGAIPGFDTGVGTEFAVPTVQQSAADVNGAVTETPVLKDQALDTDAGAIAEANVLVVKITTTDSGVGSDITNLRRLLVPVTDANGATTETQSAQFHIDGFESNGTVTESASVVRGLIPAFDSGAITEVGTVNIILQTIVVSDSGQISEFSEYRLFLDPTTDENAEAVENAYASITIAASEVVKSFAKESFLIGVFPAEGDAGQSTEVASAKFRATVSDSGVVSESTSLYKHLFFTTSDSGGLVEAAIPDAVLSATDRNKPTFENAQSPGGQVSDFDLGQGSEATHLTARLAAADVSGPVSESAGSANKGGALDLGTGTESAALHVAVSASDSGVASERTYLHQGKSSFDLGEGHESASLAARLPSYSDDGTGSDGEFIRVFVSGGIEVGRATEVFALVSKIFVTDSGVVFDKADSFVYATVSDSGTGLEYESGIGLRVFDSGSGSDAETLVALFIQKDLGSGAEGQHRDPPLVLFTDQPGGSILDPAMGHISNSPAVGTVERPFVPKGTFRWPTQGRIVK